MAKDALDTLARLLRHEVDAERRALVLLNRQCQTVLDRLAELERETARETEASRQFPGGPMLLSSFLSAHREHERALRAELEALDARRLVQLERLAEKRLEARRLERLAERRRTAAERLAERRETKALDDLVSARAARRHMR
jgi:flagellar biosynthesis chaperone FliJ